MSTDAAFLAAIAANPSDHLTKLVYADWLEEQSDPRAEFLRVQHALTQLATLGDEWWQLREQRAEFAHTLDDSWRRAASVGLEWIDEIHEESDLHERLPQAAEAGNPAAMTLVAHRCWESKPQHQPPPNLWVAFTDLAFRVWSIGDDQEYDYKNAKKWLERAVEANYAPALFSLGLMYQHGWGMWDTHPAKAANLYRRAANLGWTPAMVHLGKLFANGEGVRKNTAKAVELYRLAADAGDGDAHRLLGNRYRDGRGVRRDLAQAVFHYRQAIEHGEVSCKWVLADLLEKHPKLVD